MNFRTILAALSLSSIAACGAGSKQPASGPSPASSTTGSSTTTTADSPSPSDSSGLPPYMHPDACKTGEQMCNVDECIRWKTTHGETQDAAEMECPQACNCGE